MYKTVTVWIEFGEGKKLEFDSGCKKGTAWLKVDNFDYAGDASFHFNADGLRQFIFALEELEKDLVVQTKKEEARYAEYK